MTDEQFEHLWAKRHVLIYTSQVSYTYHRRRQRFFDLLDKSTKAATVLAGASLWAAALKDHLPLVAVGISGLGLLSLVFSYGDRKQAHKELSEGYATLQGQIAKVGETAFTVEQLNGWQVDMQQLNAKEPPSLYTLTTLCQNEVLIAYGHRDRVIPIAWPRRSLANWLSMSW